jgi:putative PIN family toxin of toxin-antitoxin system
MIVVLDTNVCVSALQFTSTQSTPTLALAKAVNQDTIATCDAIEHELVRILMHRFNWTPQHTEETLRRMLENSIRVTIHGTVKICRDPDDDMILECAERAHATVIVTGDKDLLTLGSYKHTRIINPAEYLQI